MEEYIFFISAKYIIWVHWATYPWARKLGRSKRIQMKFKNGESDETA